MTEYENNRHLWFICLTGNPFPNSEEAIEEVF